MTHRYVHLPAYDILITYYPTQGGSAAKSNQRIDLYSFSKWLEENPKVVEVIELCFVDKRSERVDADGHPIPELHNSFSMFNLISPLSKRDQSGYAGSQKEKR